MSLPPVSVIIPVYNHEKYVEQALESVFKQTYPELEVIIIDDGSKDRSAHRVEEYLKRYIPTPGLKREFQFFKQKNKGAAFTINQGLQAAKHPILTILNSDDYFAPDRLEIMVTGMKKENAEIAFSEIIGIDENGAPLLPSHFWSLSYHSSLTKHREFPSNSFGFLLGNLAISSGNLVFTRKLFDQIGPFKNLLHAHDYEFILRTILVYEPLFLRKGLYFYRMHSSNTITQNPEITQRELAQFIPDFLVKTTAAPPKNKQAPSPWNFPSEFAEARDDCKLDAYLSGKIEDLHLPQKTLAPPTKVKPEKVLSKISLITHELTFSGAPKVACDLALVLKNKGYRPRIFSLSEGPLKEYCEKNGIPVVVIPDLLQPEKHKSFFTKSLALFLLYFYLFFRIDRKVIINSFASMDAGFPLSGIPFLKRYWYIHESIFPSTKIPSSFKKWGMKLLQDPRKYTFLFGSKSTQEIWSRSGIYGKVAYWSGIPSSPLPELKKGPIKKILAMGSIEMRKGTHILVEAFIQCVKQNRIPSDVVLTIVGFPKKFGSPYQGDLVLKVIHENLQDRIRLLRGVAVDQVDRFFDEGDLFAMASSNECLPLVLLMAMSKGLPIITTTANGCEEAIEDGVSGYTCPMQNSDAFARILEKAVNSPEEARKMGQRAHAHFNALYSLEHNIEDFMKVFEDGSDPHTHS